MQYILLQNLHGRAPSLVLLAPRPSIVQEVPFSRQRSAFLKAQQARTSKAALKTCLQSCRAHLTPLALHADSASSPLMARASSHQLKSPALCSRSSMGWVSAELKVLHYVCHQIKTFIWLRLHPPAIQRPYQAPVAYPYPTIATNHRLSSRPPMAIHSTSIASLHDP